MSALVDLYFADSKDKKLHDCSVCPKRQKATRKCEQPGYKHAKRAMYKVDERGAKYFFCPGKATQNAAIAKTFQECLLAFHTGILPKNAHFEDQDALFAECYPSFVMNYTERRYGRVWKDVSEFTDAVFKVIGKMFGGK